MKICVCYKFTVQLMNVCAIIYLPETLNIKQELFWLLHICNFSALYLNFLMGPPLLYTYWSIKVYVIDNFIQNIEIRKNNS